MSPPCRRLLKAVLLKSCMLRHVVLGYYVPHVSSCWTFSWQHVQYKQITSRVLTLQIDPAHKDTRAAVRHLKMLTDKSFTYNSDFFVVFFFPHIEHMVLGFYAGTESE